MNGGTSTSSTRPGASAFAAGAAPGTTCSDDPLSLWRGAGGAYGADGTDGGRTPVWFGPDGVTVAGSSGPRETVVAVVAGGVWTGPGAVAGAGADGVVPW